MRKSIFNALILIAVLLISAVLTALYALPKAVLVDRLLTERGITLIAHSVRESFTSVELEEVRVFRGNEELSTLSALRLNIEPGGLRLKGVCGSGYAELRVGWFSGRDFTAERFTCLRDVEELEGRLSLGKGIEGRLSVRGVSVKGVSLEGVELEFRGSEFSGRITYMGMELEGSGRIRFSEEDPLKSEVSARFSGGLGAVVVTGRLEALRAEIR